MSEGWIGVDLDGTLAEYDGWVGVDHIGPPVPAMVERVQNWILDGQKVRIFTARVADHENEQHVRQAIYKWCEKHIGMVLPITNIKDFAMLELWDDRCVQVTPNTGNPVGESTRGLS